MGTITVGRAAKVIGVSARAIRLWEEKGLLSGAERSPSRYRLFSEQDLVTLRFIRQAKALGLTLGEIREIQQQLLAGTCPCQRVERAIDDRLAEIDRSIADLEQLRHTLNAARERAADLDPVDVPSVGCRIIEVGG